LSCLDVLDVSHQLEAARPDAVRARVEDHLTSVGNYLLPIVLHALARPSALGVRGVSRLDAPDFGVARRGAVSALVEPQVWFAGVEAAVGAAHRLVLLGYRLVGLSHRSVVTKYSTLTGDVIGD